MCALLCIRYRSSPNSFSFFFDSENQKKKQNQDDSDEDDDDEEAGPSFQQATAQPPAAYAPMAQPGMAPVPTPGMPPGSYSGEPNSFSHLKKKKKKALMIKIWSGISFI